VRGLNRLELFIQAKKEVKILVFFCLRRLHHITNSQPRLSAALTLGIRVVHAFQTSLRLQNGSERLKLQLRVPRTFRRELRPETF